MRVHKFRSGLIRKNTSNPAYPITANTKKRIDRLIERKRLVFAHTHLTPHKLSVFYNLGYMGPLDKDEEKS